MHRGDVHLSSTRERTAKATAKRADDRDDGQRGEDRAEGLRATHQEPDTQRRACATRQCQARSGLLKPRAGRAGAVAPARSHTQTGAPHAFPAAETRQLQVTASAPPLSPSVPRFFTKRLGSLRRRATSSSPSSPASEKLRALTKGAWLRYFFRSVH